MVAKVVDITITRQTATVTRAGFGTPLIVGPTPSDRPFVEVFAEASEMLDVGYTEDHQTYLEVVAAKSQNPSPPFVKVGKLTGVPAMELSVTVEAVTGEDVGVAINGTTYSLEGTGNANADATSLAALIDANPAVTAPDPGGSSPIIVVTAVSDTIRFDYEAFANVSVQETTQTTGMAPDFANIRNADDDWYGVGSPLRSELDLLTLQVQVNALNRIGSFTTNDPGAWDQNATDDILTQSQALGYDRTPLWATKDKGSPLGTAILCRMLTTTPGSATWAHKSLSGVVAGGFTDTELTAIEAKNGNYYRPIGGVNATWEGLAPSGEYVDVMRLVDWTEARCTEGVLQVLLANEKVPYTNNGIEMIKTPIRGVLRQGVDNGGFADDPAPTVSAPRAREVDPNTRGNRILPDVKFVAYLAGAIHAVQIRGTVSI